MNKKGQGLPLNTLVIAIIVIVVLVIVIIFFVGGMSGVTSKIKNIFVSQTAGTDKVLAVQTCNQYCKNAELLATLPDKQKSPFCKYPFYIDNDGDGEPDYKEEDKSKGYKEWTCKELGVTCSFSC